MSRFKVDASASASAKSDAVGWMSKRIRCKSRHAGCSGDRLFLDRQF